jgi:DNA-binding transcriptional ArsR family regulator
MSRCSRYEGMDSHASIELPKIPSRVPAIGDGALNSTRRLLGISRRLRVDHGRRCQIGTNTVLSSVGCRLLTLVRIRAGSRAGVGGFAPRLTIRTAWSTLHHMVNYCRPLDQTFAALADPTRRAILARLERQDGVSVSELARPLAIKLPAVMKHLDVLDDAGLITRSKAGRVVTVRLSSDPIKEAMNWLRRYERFWSGRLDRLAAYAGGKEARQSDR